MKKLIVALLMCCSTVAYGQTTNENPVTETTHQMGDDGAIKVTLPFTFTYYNKQFTDTWMYDNGVISFLPLNSPGSLNPGQWNAQPLSETYASYFIASLWADIAPVSITKYITSTDGTYMKYTWQDIAEYYSMWGNWRLNTISTTLKDDGTIETHYANINLQTSAITVGTVGDKNAGEYNQIYYSPCCIATNTSMISDWTIAGAPIIPPTPTVVQQEIYVAPQVVVEEPVTQTTVATVVTETEPTVVTTTVAATPSATTTTALVQAATESSTASVTTASIAATTSSTSSDNSSNKMSVADAQSIARTNQKNAAQLVNSVVSNSIESSMVQTITTDSDNSTNSDTNTSNTTTNSTNSNLSIVVTQSNNNVSDVGTNNAATTSSSISLSNFSRLPGAFVVDGTTETNENRVATTETIIDTSTQETKMSSSNTEIINIIADETNPTSVRSLAANNVPAKQAEDDKEKKNIEFADITKDSQVSELTNFGVQLTELQVLPIGYSIYLTAVIKDAPFYAPKAIYSNQAVVDNAPAQRLLQLASDAKFEEMVSQQYGEQK